MANIPMSSAAFEVSDEPINWLSHFDARQLKEIEFCRVYAENFNHGTDGHNAKLIIAQMAKLLDEAEYNARTISA